jgi:hypothetical protein
MERILSLLVGVFLLISCAVIPEQPRVQVADNLEESAQTVAQPKPEAKIVVHDELLNEPPENPRFIIAQPPERDAAEQSIRESIKSQLLRLGYVEAQSREDANVVIWYRYDSEQTGMRYVGRAKDVWGEQFESVAAASDLSTVMPVSFTVQIISLQESRFPGQVIRIWEGEWSSSLPEVNMAEFANKYLAKVFEQYQSEQTQRQLEAFRQARERKLKAAVNTYMKMVMYRIQSNWQKPEHNVKGKKCKVKIVQTLVGQIRSHKLLSCDRDRRFRKSIEKAIKESSPLPLPKEDSFDRSELILIFQG